MRTVFLIPPEKEGFHDQLAILQNKILGQPDDDNIGIDKRDE